MRAWFLSLFRFRDVSLPQEMKALWGTEARATVIHSTPERDELKPGCVHIYTDADELKEQIKLEQAGQKVRPFKRGTK